MFISVLFALAEARNVFVTMLGKGISFRGSGSCIFLKIFLSFSSTTQQSSQNSSSLSPQNDSNSWLHGLDSPLIQDEGDNKKLKLRFDVSQYKPEEIVVKIDSDSVLHVSSLSFNWFSFAAMLWKLLKLERRRVGKT